MAFNNKPPQEMVERAESSSPFWRSRPTAPRRETSGGSDKIIGASYSHADMLKMESLSVSGTTRPRTPPSNPTSRLPPRTKSSTATPPRRNYHRFFTDYGKGGSGIVDGNDNEDGLGLDFEEDEDEFGLPSVMPARRKRTDKQSESGPGPDPVQMYTPPAQPTNQDIWRLESGDLSEERGLPNYPTTKRSEGKILRPQYKDILKDPANLLHLISQPALPSDASSKEIEAQSARITRINKFKRILQASSISLSDLRESAWSGLPEEVRAMSWQVLLGYLPTSSERRVATLERKRKEYLDGVRQAFEKGTMGAPTQMASAFANPASPPRARGRGLDETIWHQISIDVPRTNPHLKLYAYEATQRSLERILYVWAIRHPASGYVQGINDLVTPFWQTFLGMYITDSDVEFGMDPGQLPKPVLDAVEADSFWCLTKLLDGIQDNYVHAQPGIQRQVSSLRDLTKRIDAGLVAHMDRENVEFIQFSFRWMNCLLMREVSVKNTIRMWDTYLAEEQGFSEFHLYVCAAFLVKWSSQLVNMDFQEMMMFLQSPPTREWTIKDIELLLSEAFIWLSLFRGSSAHLRGSGSRSVSYG